MCNMLCVTLHVSRLMCHVMCQVSCVVLFLLICSLFLDKVVVGVSVEGLLLKGPTRLVFCSTLIKNVFSLPIC